MGEKPKLNVTLPVWNEERCLVPNVEAVLRHMARRVESFEVVLANNGSTDRTAELAEGLANHYDPVRVVHLPEPGRGGALKAVWATSQADVVSYMDLDLSTDLACFADLIDPILRKRADICVGSRRMDRSLTRRGWRREWISRAYIGITERVLGLGLTDYQCGFKALRRSVADRLLPEVEDRGWFFDTELLARAHQQGVRIREIPVDWVEDSDSRVRVARTAIDNIRGLMRLRRGLRNSFGKQRRF